MIKFKQVSDTRQVMVISSQSKCEFVSRFVALKIMLSLWKDKEPFVILNRKDRVVFSSSLTLQNLKH